jgi:ABC-type Na+ efflux pump permease subunit
MESLRSRTRAGELLASVRVDVAALSLAEESNDYELFLREGLTRQQVDDLQGALSSALVYARAEAQEIDVERARATLAKPYAAALTLREDGSDVEENQLGKIFVPLAFMMLLWSSVWVTGNYLLTSTVEEKSNRVIEVLLSAVSPLELLTGKVIGQCAVGALMMLMYGGVGLTAASSLGYAHLVPPDKLAYVAIYFVMAFLMVAATMAAIGAAVSELRDAQTLLGPVTILFMLPLFTWFFVTENPSSTFARVISYIPPMTPFAMVLRVTSVESVPGWEIALTTLVGFGGVVGMVWAAARIFRVGILITGKPATPAELWKWVRRP